MAFDQRLNEMPEDDSAGTSVMPTELDADSQPTGSCCEKCGAAISSHESLVCRQCGWYASINSYVELDRSWEVATDPELANEADIQVAPKASLPAWAWILAGCFLTVILESLAARLLTADGSALRTIWSLTQLLIGFSSFTFCHTYCHLLGAKHDGDVKTMDYFLRPIKTWSTVIRDLPKRGPICYVGLSGFTAMTLSIVLIGGIPYERLLDWDIKKKAKFNLIGAITSQAESMPEDDNGLEEAIGDFAGQAEFDDDKKKPTPDVRKQEDCIIIGFMTNHDGDIKTLLLAAEHFSKLKYAGNVQVSGLSEEDLQELTTKLMNSRSRKPFVRISIDGAAWVKPKHLCRISYQRRGKQGGLYGAKLEDLLGDVDISGK